MNININLAGGGRRHLELAHVQMATTASAWKRKRAPSPAAFVEQLITPSRDRRNVAVTLIWPGGGSSVFLVGSFTNWTERVPMVAAEGNTHVATVHLRAGEHHYLFEVNGVMCIADEDPLMSVSPGSAPTSIVNTVLVDDGAEYEELGGDAEAAARPDSPTDIVDDSTALWSAGTSACAGADGFSTVVPTTLKVSWFEPPALPPHLARMHGVQTAAPRHIWPQGRPHAAFADCKLNHAAFARCGDDAAGDGTDAADVAGSCCSPDKSAAPEMGRSFTALAPAMTISVISRWRAHRVTNVLLKPTPALTAPFSETTSQRTTLDLLASAAIDIPLRCLSNQRPASRAQSVESMGAQSDASMGDSADSPPPSPPLQFEPMDCVPILSEAPLSWLASDFGGGDPHTLMR
jgi:hypothetical protein